MTSVLVPLDFSSGAETLVEQASDLAKDLGCAVVLMHVIEPVAAYVPVGASMDVIAPPPIEQTDADRAAPKERLETFAKKQRARGIEVETMIITGLAVDEILDQADLRKCRLIALGSHGHGALYHLFAGSVVTGVLKRAKCPVVVIPFGKRE